LFLQLHNPYGFNPDWAICEADRFGFNERFGNVPRNNEHILSNGSLNKGKWVDFIITIKYTNDKTEFVTIYRRDEGQSG